MGGQATRDRARVSEPADLLASTDRYYTAYYRDTLGIPDWTTLVQLRRQEHRQERPRVRARQRHDGRRHRPGRSERTDGLGRDQGDIHGQRDHDLVPRVTESRDEPVDGRAVVGAVVDDRERQAGQLAGLPDDEHLVARLGEDPMATLRERLAAKPGERLR